FEAEKIFQQVLNRDPDNATALAYHASVAGMKIGFNLASRDQIFTLSQQAQTEIDRAVQIAPDDADVRELRGYFNFYTPSLFGRDGLAVEDFTRVLAIVSQKPNSELDRARLHLILGDTHNKRGDPEKARSSWQQVIQLAPNSDLAAAAEARLNDLSGQKTLVSAYGKELAAIFGFLLGVVIFGFLTLRLLRDLKRRGKGALAAMMVVLPALAWNGLNLWLVMRHALTTRVAQPLPLWLAHDFGLLLSLLPILLGLLAAYRFYQAAFMDIALKRGAALLALVALAFAYAKFIEGPLTLAVLRVPNPGLQPILFAGSWIALFLLYLPLRGWIYKLVDRHLFRRRDYTQSLAEFNERLRRVTDEQSLLTATTETLREAFAADLVRFVAVSDEMAMKLRQTFNEQKTDVLTRQQAGDDLPGVELIMAVRANAELTGVILIGQRAYGQSYLSEELNVVRSISIEVSRAMENLRLHETRREQAIEEEELRKLVAQSELMALRAQINPHFFFNALNSVASLIGEDPPRAELLVENLAELFRHAFKPNTDGIQHWPLSQELELIETYMAVEQVRLGDKLHFQKFIAPEASAVKIPALTIQPLIENAIKHGIGRRNQGGAITLSATLRDGRLSIAVADTGVGIATNEMHDLLERGIGLSNVNRRLLKLYGEAAKLKVDSAPDQGTTVSFAIPLGRGCANC
ncbi:MAG: histidine kinase, partial [Acidobacteriota bacterium]|nr:histidine kinase [Acidobacteriota bacterium]